MADLPPGKKKGTKKKKKKNQEAYLVQNEEFQDIKTLSNRDKIIVGSGVLPRDLVMIIDNDSVIDTYKSGDLH